VLCANCHRAIHLTRPLMSVEKFKLRVWRGA
jgi:predicted HNH restriction endonuclease